MNYFKFSGLKQQTFVMGLGIQEWLSCVIWLRVSLSSFHKGVSQGCNHLRLNWVTLKLTHVAAGRKFSSLSPGPLHNLLWHGFLQSELCEGKPRQNGRLSFFRIHLPPLL